MASPHLTEAFSALAHPGRLAVFRLLARRAPHGVRPGEMVGALGVKASTLSTHLSALDRAGLVAARRAGKSIYYSVALDGVGRLVGYLVNDCCRGRPELCVPLAAHALSRAGEAGATGDGRLTALFVCVGNSARSVMAEVILRDLDRDRFRTASAGTLPAAAAHPLALAELAANGHDVSDVAPKDLSAVHAPGTAPFDLVVTLCDAAANEDCPPWPGLPMTVHWGLPDPARVCGPAADQARAFAETYSALSRMLSSLAALPLPSLDRLTLQRNLDEIGTTQTPSIRTG